MASLQLKINILKLKTEASTRRQNANNCDMDFEVDRETASHNINETDNESNHSSSVHQLQVIHEKVENGDLFLKPAFGRHWYQVIEKGKYPEWTISKEKNDHFQICSLCKFKSNHTTAIKFHNVYTHHGGKLCENCTMTFFGYDSWHKHTCDELQKVFVIEQKSRKAIVAMGHPKSRAFGIPMKRRARTSFWIGTTCLDSPVLAAGHQYTLGES